MEEAREGEVKVDRAEGDGLGQAEDVTVEKEKKGQEEDMNQTENEKEKPSENLKEGEEGDAEGARDRERDRERGHHHDDEEHDSQDEVLYQAFREESPIFAELCQARMDGWDDENIGRIWDKRREMLSNLDERHKSREKRNKISHVDSYYFSYRDGMTNLPSELPRHGAKVLEFGAAPGGCVKYWVEDCRAKVTAITLPVRLHGMRMSYRYSTSDVDLIEADLSVGEGYADLRDDIGASLKDWNRRLRLPEGDLFDVIHHGAIIHRGQQDVVTKEEDEQRAYRMRLTKNIYRLALFFLKPGGHLLLNLMPKLNDLLHLSLFLPLFEGFEVHRTGFRVNSRFRILLKSRREDGPIPLSVSLDGQRPWGTRLLWKFFENMTSASGREWREEPGYAEKFSNEVALAVFRRLRPALEVLWQDQINFLRWLQQRAADAKTEEELMLLAEVIAGGNAKDIDLETLFRQDQAQAEKEKALAVAGEADENTKAEAEDDREAGGAAEEWRREKEVGETREGETETEIEERAQEILNGEEREILESRERKIPLTETAGETGRVEIIPAETEKEMEGGEIEKETGTDGGETTEVEIETERGIHGVEIEEGGGEDQEEEIGEQTTEMTKTETGAETETEIEGVGGETTEAVTEIPPITAIETETETVSGVVEEEDAESGRGTKIIAKIETVEAVEEREGKTKDGTTQGGATITVRAPRKEEDEKRLSHMKQCCCLKACLK
uniref:Ribosomal RNA methyltransferase FtsJ domain-containing protein n=1 Tax=Chromera velia CCMP2878 TaxID=1169474 RepID=A0A0G4HYY0_9ALVE|eukprot:Cvel_9601.t1-p1 / transcript=Cvel_9601.t1 / gene=Cvel_9601 / organism=Chromera_velia_CCMP2878 / gene_product=hypothetical protein / transcript_product=hypothetical protein / location=Cvel_scaffold557:65783-70827(-) / protein_length=727 / sequence_SO=supercontig / SO=protein_coding / is_pseudo=false